MDRGAWRVILPWGCKESDITERLSTSQFRPEIYLFLYYSNFLDIYVDNFMLHLLMYVNHSLPTEWWKKKIVFH